MSYPVFFKRKLAVAKSYKKCIKPRFSRFGGWANPLYLTKLAVELFFSANLKALLDQLARCLDVIISYMLESYRRVIGTLSFHFLCDHLHFSSINGYFQV
jgi:hypothetical protein